jgi:hypothetical protein
MKQLFTLLAALLMTTNALAHEASKGPNGGTQVDAGNYHVEMVARDTALTVYLHDEKEKPVDTKGYKATGIFVIDGKPQRIELKADTANKLTGLLRFLCQPHSRAPSRSLCPRGKPYRPSSSDAFPQPEDQTTGSGEDRAQPSIRIGPILAPTAVLSHSPHHRSASACV